jgi:hypothetical protein
VIGAARGRGRAFAAPPRRRDRGGNG